MRFLRLEVSNFRGIGSAEVDLRPGLNVLFGPNDLGKSTLALALKAVLVLPGTSSLADDFVPWRDPRLVPEVTLTFEAEGDTFRLTRRFTTSEVELECATAKGGFTSVAKGKKVDEKLRQLFAWGLPASVRGMPESFLVTALLSSQSEVSALFERGLDEDDDASGQALVSKVLASLSRDERVTKLLERAQDEVDRAFTSTGKRRAGRNSPLAVAEAEVARLEAERVERQHALEEETSLRQSLDGLERTWREASARADELEVRALEVERQQGSGEGAAARALAESTQQALDAWDALHSERAARQASLSSAAGQLEAKTRRAHTALAAKKTAAEALRSLEQQQRDATRSKSDADRALARSENQAEQARLQSRRAEVQALLDAQALATQLEAERARRDAAKGDLELINGIIAYGQWRSAVDARARAGEGADLSALEKRRVELAAAVERARTAARTTREELQQVESKLPSSSQRESMQRLRRELETAEAALGGGFTLQVRTSDTLLLRTVVDDGVPADEKLKPGAERELEAERRAHLEVGQQFQVDVIAGAPEKRRDAEHLKRRWRQEAVPALEAVGLRTFAELEERLARVGPLSERLASLEREAQLQQHELERHDEKLAAAKERVARVPDLAELKTREARIGALPREVLEPAWRALGERWEFETSGQQRVVQETFSSASASVAKLEGELSSLLRQAGAGAKGDVAALQSELTRLESNLVDLARQARELDAQSDPRASLVNDVQRAKDALHAAEQEAEEAENAQKQTRTLVASLEGELKALDAQLARQSRTELVERLRQANQRSTASAAVGDERRKAKDARSQAERASQAFASSLGGLQHIGGARVKDALEETLAALARAQREVEQLRREADAWKLLRDSLTEADSRVGADLGAALSEPVSRAFASLTGKKYGAVEFDGGLRVRTVDVHAASPEAAEDALGVLSVGTRDHLATLIRLALATQLKAPVVLDDHLVHSDATRMAWFREALAAAAKETQVVVITCRPEDYRGARGHAVDLEPLLLPLPARAGRGPG